MSEQEKFTGETIPDLIPGKICFGVFAKEDGSNMDLNDEQVMHLHILLVSMNVQPHMLVKFGGYKLADGKVRLDWANREKVDDES